MRYWTGERWDDQRALRTIGVAVPTRPLQGQEISTYLSSGLFLSLLSAALLLWGFAEDLPIVALIGVVALVFGILNLSIGTVARGVQVGMRAHQKDYL